MARSPDDQCARCWARNVRPCEVCNYPLDRKPEDRDVLCVADKVPSNVRKEETIVRGLTPVLHRLLKDLGFKFLKHKE